MVENYIVPEPVLNRFHGLEANPPAKDAAYPVPIDWLRANVKRWYFTDEQIIAAAKPEFDDSTSHRWCPQHGVYFLILEGRIMYVGMSTHVVQRLIQHDAKGMPCDSVTFFHAPEIFLDDIEAYYIWRIKPPLNNKYPIRYYYHKYVEEMLSNDRKGAE
jgi:hypothetical protein